MIFKLLIGLVAILAGWLLWRGPGKHRPPGTPIDPVKIAPVTVISPEVLEARRVLGVGASADADEIRAAYRRLAAAVHPDRGGSAELAQQVNSARDILIGRGPDPTA